MKKKSFVGKSLLAVLLIIFMAVIFSPVKSEAKVNTNGPVFAADSADTEEEEDEAEVEKEDNTGSKAIAAAIAIGIAAAGGAIGMGLAIAKANEGISRQPEADGKIRTNLMLGLVFIETAIIYALVVTILIIFVM